MLPFTNHLTIYLSKTDKTYGTLLEKQGQTHNRRSMDPYTQTRQCWLTSKDFYYHLLLLLLLLLIRVFHISVSWCFFHLRLSDSKSSQVSRTLLSILAVFNNAVVWMVSTRPPTSKYYYYSLSADTEGSLEDLPGAINYRDGWCVCVCVCVWERERERE